MGVPPGCSLDQGCRTFFWQTWTGMNGGRTTLAERVRWWHPCWSSPSCLLLTRLLRLMVWLDLAAVGCLSRLLLCAHVLGFSASFLVSSGLTDVPSLRLALAFGAGGDFLGGGSWRPSTDTNAMGKSKLFPLVCMIRRRRCVLGLLD